MSQRALTPEVNAQRWIEVEVQADTPGHSLVRITGANMDDRDLGRLVLTAVKPEIHVDHLVLGVTGPQKIVASAANKRTGVVTLDWPSWVRLKPGDSASPGAEGGPVGGSYEWSEEGSGLRVLARDGGLLLVYFWPGGSVIRYGNLTEELTYAQGSATARLDGDVGDVVVYVRGLLRSDEEPIQNGARVAVVQYQGAWSILAAECRPPEV